MTDPVVQFEEAMSDDDYGIIIGRDGELKGLFVPTLICLLYTSPSPRD